MDQREFFLFGIIDVDNFVLFSDLYYLSQIQMYLDIFLVPNKSIFVKGNMAPRK
jgi:hypothetical protein